ncbi:protein of unknown function [Amphibacillus marinus]|uniref:Uncharacterized protein n=1 Tax=Amphibacillus marinus TaxID=872970 RepID=A0A1H8TVW7_9BACI|nr:DUF5085 family protein [Amphibacillus marinus]SEO94683.1 protein of unknown function [Amphibacillus marinus]
MLIGHQIAYRNVASKYYHCKSEDLQLAFEDFTAILERNMYHPTGDMFFALISDPTEDEMIVEIFLPIQESVFQAVNGEQIYFQSYYTIKPMVMTRITENFNQLAQDKYWELFSFLHQHDYKQRTPIFVEYKQTKNNHPYIEMGIGIYPEL